MKVATVAEMRHIDNSAIRDFFIPGLVLMENAGIAVVKAASELLGCCQNRRIVILAGKGNNGGDGLVAARHLSNGGSKVRVYLLGPRDEIKGDAGVNLAIWLKLGQTVEDILPGGNLPEKLLQNLELADLVIDAAYGTGFRGEVRGAAVSLFNAVNNCRTPVLAVDIPSGLEADTGRAAGSCVKATATVTFGLPKIGLLTGDGPGYAGRVKVEDISIPKILLESNNLKKNLIDREMIKAILPRRGREAHKGDCGRVLVVAGSRGYTGAACLAAYSAARVGAGLVTLGTPEEMQPVAAVKLTEVMTFPLPQTPEGTLSRQALPAIKALLERADVLALGPGLTNQPETAEVVRSLLENVNIPCVLDADGLNAFVGHADRLARVPGPLVLTPHPGEMARLAGVSIAEVQADRLSLVAKYAREWGVTLLLKGAGTLVAEPGGPVYINSTGNPGMASGGTGDVLTGVIAGLLAQGMDPAGACTLGVYLHGLAGDVAAAKRGLKGLLAGDVIDCLPGVLRELEEYSKA